LAWILSRTTWQSISICLVLSWKTGLAAMCIADLLSQYMRIGDSWGIRKSCRRYNRHWPSQAAWAKTRYSASDDDLETTNCFLLFQLINDEPRKKQRHVVDLLVSGHAPQSESENPLRISDDDWWYSVIS
jgi:hypothetical protein